MSLVGDKLNESKRIVVKVGSSILVNQQGKIAKSSIENLIDLIITLRNQRKQIVLVSSGAVAAADFNFKANLISLPLKQALASIGQVKLMEYYQKAFAKQEVVVGQILFSKHSIKDRIAYLNARNTLRELLKLKALPIINENDSLATDEFKFGDNDVLGALTCGLVEADLYLILSNVAGFYDDFQGQSGILPLIKKIDESIYEKANFRKSEYGTGGMQSKLKACELARQWGIPVFLTSGKVKNLYDNIFKEQNGTLFYNENYKKISSKKKWLWSNYDAKGDIFIDQGAKNALKGNKSLLASGVIEAKGNFQAGDFCNIVHQGDLLARGMVNFSLFELTKIKGSHSTKIAQILGYPAHSEVVHKDNLISFE